MDPSLPIVDLPDLQRPHPDPPAGGSESRGLGGPPRPGGFRFASRRGGGRPRIDGGDPGPSDTGPRPGDSDGRAVGRAPGGGNTNFPASVVCLQAVLGQVISRTGRNINLDPREGAGPDRARGRRDVRARASLGMPPPHLPRAASIRLRAATRRGAPPQLNIHAQSNIHDTMYTTRYACQEYPHDIGECLSIH